MARRIAGLCRTAGGIADCVKSLRDGISGDRTMRFALFAERSGGALGQGIGNAECRPGCCGNRRRRCPTSSSGVLPDEKLIIAAFDTIPAGWRTEDRCMVCVVGGG